MSTSQVRYLGSLRTSATHLKSQSEIITDAPTDNHGKGQAFSPTDLIATSLASCMLTVIGIKGSEMGIPLGEMKASVEKMMESSPRRVSQINVEIHFATSLREKHFQILKNTALTCPVANSLHPGIIQNITFHQISD